MYRGRHREVKQRRHAYCRATPCALVAIECLLLLALLRVDAAAQCPPLPAGNQASATTPVACRFDAALARLFTPADVPKDTYRVYVTPAPIDRVVAGFREVAPAQDGAWTLQAMDPLEAYGESGTYDRSKVARLYLGIRARVARGPVILGGRTTRSITLVSPYPDATLSRLNPGTLIIEFVLPTRQFGGW